MNHQGPPSPNQPYNRPNRPYVCGRQCEGTPCQLGPTPNGKCSDKENPCKPKWSMRKKRSFFTLLSCFTSLAIVFYCLQVSSVNPMLFNPGPLSNHHAKLIRPSNPGEPAKCSKCHNIDDHEHWITNGLLDHNHSIDSQACVDCHQLEPDHGTESKTNWLKPHGLSDASAYPEHIQAKFEQELHCIQCHREHRGLHSSITIMPQQRCQSCHEESFNSFSNGHPEFKSFPYRHTPSIAFNHGRKEHQSMDCASCHTYNRLEEKYTLASFENACASCHQSELINTDKYKFNVLSLGVPRTSTDPSQFLKELLGSDYSQGLAPFQTYLKEKQYTDELLNNQLPEKRQANMAFLQTLFKGIDLEQAKQSLGIFEHESASLFAASKQKEQSKTDFFLLNFFALQIKEKADETLAKDLLDLFLSLDQQPQRKVMAYYLSELFQDSTIMNEVLKVSQPEKAILLAQKLEKKETPLSKLLSTHLYKKGSKPLQLNEQEQSFYDELLDLIEGDFDDDEWVSWDLQTFYAYIFVEEELSDADVIWSAMEDDNLEDKYSDEDVEDLIPILLKERKEFFNNVFTKLKEPFKSEPIKVTLSDEENDLLEEFEDIIDSEYDDLSWAEKSLEDFLNELILVEEFLETDTILSSLENEDLEEALDKADDEEVVAVLVKFIQKPLEHIFIKLKENHLPSQESLPAFLVDYSEAYKQHLKDRKSRDKTPYLFDKPTPQWIYSKEDQKVSYAVGLHKDPIQKMLLDDKTTPETKKAWLSKLGDCQSCHTHPSIATSHVKNQFLTKKRKTLHKFKHITHTQNMSLSCAQCHVQEGQGPVTKSGFYPIQKDLCSNCHQSSLAGDDCLQCHNYHADELVSDLDDVQGILKTLGLDQ